LSIFLLQQSSFTQNDIHQMYMDAVCAYQHAEYQANLFGVPLTTQEHEVHQSGLADLIRMMLDRVRWRFFDSRFH